MKTPIGDDSPHFCLKVADKSDWVAGDGLKNGEYIFMLRFHTKDVR